MVNEEGGSFSACKNSFLTSFFESSFSEGGRHCLKV